MDEILIGVNLWVGAYNGSNHNFCLIHNDDVQFKSV